MGDVEAQTLLKVNRKGGSVTAILKKIIVDRLNLTGEPLAAATIRLDSGQTLLLMGAEPLLGDIHVIRSGKNSFQIVAAADGDLEVGPLTEAFLTLKAEQFKRGQLNLSGPYSAERWEALSREDFEQAERLLGR